MPTPREELEQFRASAKQKKLTPRQELEQFRTQAVAVSQPPAPSPAPVVSELDEAMALGDPFGAM